MIKSVRALARAVKRDESAVRKWLKNPDWPFGSGPWKESQLALIKAWAQTNLAPNMATEDVMGTSNGGDGSSKMHQAKLLVLIERARAMKFERELREGKYHPVETCMERRVRQIRAFREALQIVGMRLAPGLVGCSANQIEEAINNELRTICEEFASGTRGQEEPQPEAIAQLSLTPDLSAQ